MIAMRGSLIARHSLLRNSFYIMLTTAINSGLGYVFWIVVARSYPANQVGIAAALIAAMTLIAAIANLGTSPALIQRLPQARSDAEWSRILSTSLITGAVAGLAIALLSALVILPAVSSSLSVAGSSAANVLLFSIGVAIWSVSLISDYLFIAERRSENMAARNFGFGLLKLVVVLVVPVITAKTALSIFGSWTVGCALSLLLARVLLLPRLDRAFRLRLRGALTTLRSMARAYFGNYLTTLGNVIPFALLPTLVVSRLSATDNAYFYVTWLLGGAFFVISSAVGSALFAEGTNDPDRIEAQTRSAIRITAALLAPMMVLFFVAGHWLLKLFGAGYSRNGGTLLIILTASAIPDAVTNIYVARLRAQGHLAFPAVMNMVMAAVTLLGAWLLLPPLGIAGAGVGWIAAQSAGTAAVVIHLILQRRRAGSAAAPRHAPPEAPGAERPRLPSTVATVPSVEDAAGGEAGLAPGGRTHEETA